MVGTGLREDSGRNRAGRARLQKGVAGKLHLGGFTQGIDPERSGYVAKNLRLPCERRVAQRRQVLIAGRYSTRFLHWEFCEYGSE